MSSPQPIFTGRRRKLKTHWSVRWSDVASEGIITVGGIGTIVAVCLVALVLVMEVLPLFGGATVEPISTGPAPWQTEELVHFQMNEYQTMGWALLRDGTLRTVRLTPPGAQAPASPFAVIEETRLVEGSAVTTLSTNPGDDRFVLGLEDGSVRVAEISFTTTFLDPVEWKDWLADQGQDRQKAILTEPGDTALYEGGVVQMTPQGQYRVQQLEWTLSEAVPLAEAAIRRIDHLPETGSDVRAALGGREMTLAVLAADGQVTWGVIRQRKDLTTGEVSIDHEAHTLPPADTLAGPPAFVLMSALGRNIYVADERGVLVRYDIREPDAIHVAETVDLLPESDARLTACQWILGRETVFCGDSDGGVSGWFTIRLDGHQEDHQDDAFADRQSRDGLTLVRAHAFPLGPGAVTAFGASSRSRMFFVGYDEGSLTLFHMTTEKQVVRLPAPSPNNEVRLAQIAPRDNGLLLETDGQLSHYALSPGFPDITLASLFLPVWYEGYAEPLHMWQSSSSEIEDELKFSLLPLLFGTFKATFYSLLFGAPIALLAAVYTSEFSTKRTRSVVKPTVEMMASLPSVVLGFVAALVFAPVVEQVVPACLAAIFIIPLTILLAAYLWQLLPRSRALRWESYRLWLLVPTLLLGMGLSYLAGPLVEAWLFMGSIKYWLSHPGEGSGVGGWLLILLPFSALLLGMVDGYLLRPVWRSRATQAPRHVFALLGLAKFVVMVIGALLLALVLGGLLELIGWDPRGTYLGSYDQRNSLIVGFVMGFAVIPIIYTISDDALSTVPNHLRSASLGCGATPWQTTLRVVIPTAMSGLFSALMIGLGRVAGETMIVLMAGGNTPIQDWNIFNGFRTLSTNIAIELPEAVQGSSHYRVLFVSALVLFLLTFLINTVAEVVRLYFRRKAYQL